MGEEVTAERKSIINTLTANFIYFGGHNINSMI